MFEKIEAVLVLVFCFLFIFAIDDMVDNMLSNERGSKKLNAEK